VCCDAVPGIGLRGYRYLSFARLWGWLLEERPHNATDGARIMGAATDLTETGVRPDGTSAG
jgi:hypothetical protein